MNHWINQIAILIAGDPDEFQLEHRNLNGACFVAVLGVLLGLLSNSFVDFNLIYNITIIISGSVYLVLYYFSRVRKKVKNINVLFLIISIVCLSIVWFLSQGIEGSTPYIYFGLLFISLITFRTQKYLTIISFYVLSLFILIFIQYINPSLIVPYANKAAQFSDLSFGLLVTILIFSYLATSLKKNYENERAKVERQKVEIEKQNKEIQDKNAELEEKQEEINAQNEKIMLQKEQLEEINQNLMDADELKSRFFANISHEFRTPLTLILGPLESLLEKTTDKNLVHEYSLMLKHSKRLLHLINQLLDISKIEKGKMQLVLTETCINAMIRTIISSYVSYAEKNKITFRWVEEDKDIKAFFDEDKLEKILYNLLSNAFKFTKKGGQIEVRIQLSAILENVEIIVSDTGIGIPSEKIQHIFDRFYQVDGGKNREYEGTGIGLALTHELVTLHKGTIEVSSTPGKGSAFKVTLPLDKTLYTGENIIFKDDKTGNQTFRGLGIFHDTPETEGLPVSKFLTSKKTVLIVENNIDMLNHLVKNISGQYRVVEANNGEEGMQKALKTQPDLILSDIMMPGIDGLQLTHALKENPLTCHIPIILLTARAGEESKLEGFRLQADDYITKPFSIKEVMARINAQIANRQMLRDRFEKTISVVPSEITTSSLDERFLRKILQTIEINMGNPAFSVDDLCKEMSMSRTNIHLKLKAITNQSTTEFIRSIRLKRAAQLIHQKAGNTGEIADMTGFSNLPYFSRCFKEYFKVSPSEY